MPSCVGTVGTPLKTLRGEKLLPISPAVAAAPLLRPSPTFTHVRLIERDERLQIFSLRGVSGSDGRGLYIRVHVLS